MKDEDKEKFMELTDARALAVVIAGEARGEADDPKIPYDEARDLVGSIVLNRADYGQRHEGWGKNYGNTVKTVISAKNQFSCLNSNDPNYAMLLGIIDDFDAALLKYSWLPKIYADAVGLVDGSIPRNCKGIYYETLTCHGLWDQFKKRDGHDPIIEVVLRHHRVYKTT